MSTGKRKRPQGLDEVISKDKRGLGNLLARARELDKMDQALADALDPRHSPHVRVANVRDKTLILATPVAPIAARLRMDSSRVLEHMQRLWPGEFHRLEVRVTPDLPGRQTP